MTVDSVPLLVINAVVIPAAGDREWFHGWLSVGADGRIAAIGDGSPPPPEGATLDVGGAFVAPGFVSAHSHIYTLGMRGVAHSDPLYAWVSRNTTMMLGAEPDDLYNLSLAGALDHLAAGVTSVYNFTQSRVLALFDYTTSTLKTERVHGLDFVTRQIDGMADSGIRFVASMRLDDEQLPEDECFDAFGAAIDHLDTVATDRNLGGSVYGAVQWSSTPRTAERERELMDRYRITNQAHFVETAEQIDIQQAKFDYYDRAGVLGPGFAFGHFVHPTEHMRRRVIESGTSVVWQPMSNGRLASGIADIPPLLAADVTVGMGVDDQSCTDLTDPFENMRLGLFSQRAVATDASVMSPYDVLRLHTLGSARAIGAGDRVGSLEVGKCADFLVVDPGSPDLGPVWDPVATYVLACGLRNLAGVYVGGTCVWDGRSRNPLAEAAVTLANEAMVRSAAGRSITPALPLRRGR